MLELLHLLPDQFAARDNGDLLGLIAFREGDGWALDLPGIGVDIAPLPDGGTVYEAWKVAGPTTAGESGGIRYRHDENFLFGSLSLDELATTAHGTSLQNATEAAYREIFGLLDRLQFPALLRLWNYLPQINAETSGIERYRQFNIGRQDAFLACARGIQGNVPAACALGAASGRLNIAFLAARAEPVGIENPRQVSAYDYPQFYGPRSPTFSRASHTRVGDDVLLFISGTASIVGHQTLHPDDIVAQTEESMTNIEAVLSEAGRLGEPCFSAADLHYKVYVRHPHDLDAVRSEMHRLTGRPDRILYLRADVCRGDLLVEIEAFGRLPKGSA
jgi:enamine deaminase RidA (YjgF/YER057c/UK114 family)